MNGDDFLWSWLWTRLAARFGGPAAGYDGIIRPLEKEMAHNAPVWRELTAKHQLRGG